MERYARFQRGFEGHFRSKTRSVFRPARDYLSGLMQAHKKNMERMEEVVVEADDQRLQHMLTESRWNHHAVLDQVALGKGHLSTLIDEPLYLPEEWASNPARCRKAGIPDAQQKHQSKSALALEMVRHQRALGLRFAWVGADGGYGKDSAFLRGLEAQGETFVVDIHKDQQIY